MDHPECILARLSTENTGRRQEKHKKAQHRKIKRYATRTPRTAVGEPRCSRKVTSSYLL